jgi:hypothetical protein
MLVMYAAWLSCMRSLQDLNVEDPTTEALLTPQSGHVCVKRRSRFHDIVDINRVDLCADEYGEPDDDGGPEVDEGLQGIRRWLWSLYYWFV